MMNQILMGKSSLDQVSRVGAYLNLSSLATDKYVAQEYSWEVRRWCSWLAQSFNNVFYVLVQIYCRNSTALQRWWDGRYELFLRVIYCRWLVPLLLHGAPSGVKAKESSSCTLFYRENARFWDNVQSWLLLSQKPAFCTIFGCLLQIQAFWNCCSPLSHWRYLSL